MSAKRKGTKKGVSAFIDKALGISKKKKKEMTDLAAKRGMTMERLIEVGPDDASQAFREGYWNIVKGKPKGNFGRGNPELFKEGQEYAKKTAKKHGGKITYKMSGGQVVDAGYE